MSGSSEILVVPGAMDANAGSNVDVARFRNWNPPMPPRLSPITALLCVASIAIPQLVQLPPEKPIVPVPLLVSVLPSVVPDSRYTSVLFAVHAVVPVTGFEAQEFTTLDVGMRVGVTLLPSILTTEIPEDPPDQAPLGTYETTFVPLTIADSELDG
ncbi:MAG: hypothetical protein M3A44_06140 [Gammaproteobacteria bacterium]